MSKKADDIAAAGYQGILELRNLHRQLDQAVLAAYGWSDLDLGHDFHAIETLAETTGCVIRSARRRARRC